MTQSARPAASAILLRLRLPRFLFKNPLHHAGADTQLSADLEDAITVSPQLQNFRLDRGLNPTPTQLCTFRPSASKPSIDPLPNDSPLELGKHAKHLKHRFASSRRSIESLLVEEQTDALVMKALEYAEQVGERSSEPIHRPRRDHFKLFRVHRLHHGVKPGALIPALSAADASILVDLDNLPTGSLCHRLQLAALIVGVLLRGADPQVDCDVLHRDLP